MKTVETNHQKDLALNNLNSILQETRERIDLEHKIKVSNSEKLSIVKELTNIKEFLNFSKKFAVISTSFNFDTTMLEKALEDSTTKVQDQYFAMEKSIENCEQKISELKDNLAFLEKLCNSKLEVISTQLFIESYDIKKNFINEYLYLLLSKNAFTLNAFSPSARKELKKLFSKQIPKNYIKDVEEVLDAKTYNKNLLLNLL